MRKLLIAALLSMWIPIGAPALAQYIPHVLLFGVYAAKGDGTYEDKPFLGVRYAGDAQPTKQGCEDLGVAHLPKVTEMLEAAFGAKADKDFTVKVLCVPAEPGEGA